MKKSNDINVFLNKHKRMYYTVLFCVLFLILFLLSFTVVKIVRIKQMEDQEEQRISTNQKVDEEKIAEIEIIEDENIVEQKEIEEKNEEQVNAEKDKTIQEVNTILPTKNEEKSQINSQIKNEKVEEKIASAETTERSIQNESTSIIKEDKKIEEQTPTTPIVENSNIRIEEKKSNPVPTGKFIYKHNTTLENQVISALRTAIDNDEIHKECGTTVTNATSGNGQGFTYRGMYQMTTSKLGAGRQNYVYVEDEYSEYTDGSSVKTGNTLVYIY